MALRHQERDGIRRNRLIRESRSRFKGVLLATLGLALCTTLAHAAPQSHTRTVLSQGRKILVRVIPGRAPAVVLDAGGGEDSTYWSDLAPKLAAATGSEIVSYDRAGVGVRPDHPIPTGRPPIPHVTFIMRPRPAKGSA